MLTCCSNKVQKARQRLPKYTIAGTTYRRVICKAEASQLKLSSPRPQNMTARRASGKEGPGRKSTPKPKRGTTLQAQQTRIFSNANGCKKTHKRKRSIARTTLVFTNKGEFHCKLRTHPGPKVVWSPQYNVVSLYRCTLHQAVGPLLTQSVLPHVLIRNNGGGKA